jgi:hypothetical protein
VKGIQFYSNKGPGPLQRGDNHKNEKNRVGSFKNHLANFIQTWHKSSLGVGDLSLLKKKEDSPAARGYDSKIVKMH